MIKFLIKQCVLKKNLDLVGQRKAYGELSSYVGIGLNLILSILKITVGVVFKSISVLGDGINNLSDATSSVITLFGFKYSSKPADKQHPFGHARMEYVSGLIVSFIIMFIGFELFTTSFKKIFNESLLVYDNIIIASLVISIIIKLWLYFFNIKISKEIKSTTIEATAKDSLNDVYVSSGVLVSIIFFKFTGINLDAYVGVILSFVIMYAGVNLIKDTLSPLLGEAPDYELIKDTYQKLKSYENVIDTHDLIIHSYGYNKYFASVHIEIDASLDIMIAHEMADSIERDFKGLGMQLVVHLDPIRTDCEESNMYKEFIRKTIREIDKSITMHDFRMVLGPTYNNLIFDVVLPCEVEITEKKLKTMIDEKVHSEYPNCFTVIEVDKHYNGL